MNKLFYLDTETTGLDPKMNDIVQLAFIIEIDKKVEVKHNFYIQPFDYHTINKSALEVNQLTIAKLKTFEQPRDSYLKLIKILDKYVDKYDKKDKFHPAGYNVNFDINILKQFFLKNNDKYYGSYFNYHCLDPLSMLALLEYKGLIELENYKLKTVCDYFGIKIDAHNAMSDIIATRELIQRLLTFL